MKESVCDLVFPLEDDVLNRTIGTPTVKNIVAALGKNNAIVLNRTI